MLNIRHYTFYWYTISFIRHALSMHLLTSEVVSPYATNSILQHILAQIWKNTVLVEAY